MGIYCIASTRFQFLKMFSFTLYYFVYIVSKRFYFTCVDKVPVLVNEGTSVTYCTILTKCDNTLMYCCSYIVSKRFYFTCVDKVPVLCHEGTSVTYSTVL